MKKLNDFGEKIGGARKDVWSNDFADSEVTRDLLWPKPNPEGPDFFVSYWKNEARKCVYPKPKVYKKQDSHALTTGYKIFVKGFKEQVEAVADRRGISDFCQSVLDGDFFLKKTGRSRTYDYSNEDYRCFIDGNKLLKITSPMEQLSMEMKMKKTGYGYSKDEREQKKLDKEYPIRQWDDTVSEENGQYVFQQGYSKWHFRDDLMEGSGPMEKGCWFICRGSRIIYACSSEEGCRQFRETKLARNLKQTRKGRLVPPQLEHITRSGPNYRQGRPATASMYMKEFGIRAGEFGNWVSGLDGQVSLDMAYDALRDLAIALSIPDRYVSLPGLTHGALAMAFGARGRGDALAHYEPGAEVINLTKLHGAGSLAHEWGHALDNRVGESLGGVFASSMPDSKIPAELKALIKTMRYTENGARTKFYSDAITLDSEFAKSGFGYWQSKEEMFARAFACYVKDKLEYGSDYLTGHADSCSDGKEAYAYPTGEERKRINNAFDSYITHLKEKGILAQRQEDLRPARKAAEKSSNLFSQEPCTCKATTVEFSFSLQGETLELSDDFSFTVGADGQLSFSFF